MFFEDLGFYECWSSLEDTHFVHIRDSSRVVKVVSQGLCVNNNLSYVFNTLASIVMLGDKRMQSIVYVLPGTSIG